MEAGAHFSHEAGQGTTVCSILGNSMGKSGDVACQSIFPAINWNGKRIVLRSKLPCSNSCGGFRSPVRPNAGSRITGVTHHKDCPLKSKKIDLSRCFLALAWDLAHGREKQKHWP